ncbi:MAG: LPS export ABC transporter periplasmic protein LptC [Deltaproteobacteria bacterium]|nr:LPS export ABC transporter periplasmic protein LptC [Deltaproteobacteria bacterium]
MNHAIAFVIAIVALCAACGGTTRGPSKDDPELTFKGMRFAQYENGTPIFAATARSAKGDMKSGLELSRVTVTHRGFAEAGTVVITADTAFVATEGNEAKQIDFRGGVVIKDDHGRVVKTDRALGSFSDKRVSAPGAVTLASPEINASATSIEGSLDTMEFTLHGPVEGRFDPAAAKALAPP